MSESLFSDHPYFAAVAAVFALFVVFLFIVADIQAKVLRRQSENWPEIDATVSKTINHKADPSDHDLVVSYTYHNTQHENVARNPFGVETSRKSVGDTVTLKVNPDNPAQCLLIS